MSRLSRLIIPILLLSLTIASLRAETITYTFSSKAWAASPANWTSGKEGNQLTTDRGIQVTSKGSGANGTSPISFTDVSQVVVTYSTNATAGAGSIAVKIGSNTAVSQNVTKTGGTTDRTLTYNFSPTQTGNVKVTVTCTTNSIYVKSVSITYGGSGGGGDPDPEPCDDCGSGECDIFSETWDGTSGTGGNDNLWSGTIATSNIVSNRTGWTNENCGGANQCLKLSTSNKKGSAETPPLAYTGSNNLTLTFRAAAWNGNTEKLTVNLTATNATLSESSVTLEKATWNNYEVTLSGVSTGFKVKWEAADASNNRFFLDDICIKEAAPAATYNVTLSRSGITEVVNGVTEGTLLDNIDGTGTQGGCDEWRFVGWTKTERPAHNDASPVELVTQVTDAGPYYAVYAKEKEGGLGKTHTMQVSDASGTFTIADGITGVGAKGTNENNAPAWIEPSVRFYGGNTLTISSTSANLTRIAFTFQSGGGSNAITASSGEMSNSNTVWTGDAVSSVTFTIGGTSGHRRILAITIGGGGYEFYSTTALCGPHFEISGQTWVTSTAGQTVKAVLDVEAILFNGAATMSATSSSPRFNIVGLANTAIPVGGNAQTTLVVEYTPVATADGTEATTITISATDPTEGAISNTYTLSGRHLPTDFVIATKYNDTWLALPANMAGANKYAGVEITVDDIDNPTAAQASVATLYGLKAVNAANYAEYGDRVRFVGNLGKLLWGSDAASAGTINNNATESASHNYEWTLTTDDGVNYTIQNVAYDIKAGNTPGYRSLKFDNSSNVLKFGMYVNGQSSMRLLPVSCNNQPTVSQIITTSSTATITFVGNPLTDYNLYIKQGGVEIPGLAQTTIESPILIEGLTHSTTYTCIISPSTIADDCRLEAEFTTKSAPIDIVLSRKGKTETLTQVENPYLLPESADACEEWQFAGWSATPVAENSTSYTRITQATADGTYYAVYKQPTGDDSYSLVTSASQLVAGSTYVIAYYDEVEGEGSTAGAYNSKNKYLEQNTASVFNATGTKIIKLGGGTQQFVLGGSSGYWTLTSSGLLRATAAKRLVLGGENGESTWDITIADNEATITSNDATLGVIKFNSSNPRFTNYTASAADLLLPRLYRHDASLKYSSAASTCIDCDDSGAYFSLGEEVTRNTESDNFINEVMYVKTNTSAKSWTSSNSAVATVDELTGEVSIMGEGTTTITMRQAIDITNSPDNVCAVKISYLLTVIKPTVDVVEVTADDKIIIEHDIDSDSKLVVSELVEGTDGNIADDIFISKYFEAANNMKLFGIYNGTMKYIDLSRLRVRAGDNSWSTGKGQQNYIEFKDISKLGSDFRDYRMPPCTELIFWSNNYGGDNKTLRDCISMTIGGETYDYDDMENGVVPNWYCLGATSDYGMKDADGNNQFTFNGDESLILERTNDGGLTWEAIDLFGAGTQEAPVTPKYANKNQRPDPAEGNGKIKEAENKKDNEKYTINGNANTPLNDFPGGFWAKVAGIDIPLSTNRYYLVRKKEVKSGANAVASNAELFATLETEWTGKPVGGDDAAFCYSGEMFAEVGQYDFANYYSDYEEISLDEQDFQHEADGTWSIHVDNLSQYSCQMLRVEVVDKDDKTDVKARVDYPVPIIVTGTKTTADAIFTDHDVETCRSCNVVVLGEATLEKAATGDISEINDLEIYAGGKLKIPAERSLSINQLVMRSKEDVVSRLAVDGTLDRAVADIYFDKRITEDRWYWFALPFDCNVADIHFRTYQTTNPQYGTDYVIKYYDGATRATGVQSGNWKVFEGETLLSGVGYILGVTPHAGHKFLEMRFPMRNANIEATTRATINVPVKAYGATTDVRPNNLGWNLVGNPYLDDYGGVNLGYAASPLKCGKLEKEMQNGKWTGHWTLNTTGEYGSLRYVVVPTEGGYGDYEQVAIGTKEIEPFMSYFVQIDGNSDGQELSVQFAKANLPPASIRRRAYSPYTEEPIVWVELSLSNEQHRSDLTTLLINDGFTDDYDMMNDLVKWRGDRYSRYSKPVLASRNNQGEMAFNALSEESAQAGVPINYFASADGYYTFHLTDTYDTREVEAVELLDTKLQQTCNLRWEDYTFYSTRTDDTKRFVLRVRLRKGGDIATSEEGHNHEEAFALVRDGEVLIDGLSDETRIWVYTMDGRLVATARSHNGSAIVISLPQTGVYNIRVVGQRGSQTLRTIVR